MKEKKNLKADILLLLALILCGLVLALALFCFRQEGAYVEIRVSGQTVDRFSLADTVHCEITGAGGGTNLLVIENGRAWIESADCPDALCCRMGSIQAAGQSVVCLPHEVVVEIVGETASPQEIDLVVG